MLDRVPLLCAQFYLKILFIKTFNIN